MLKTENASLKAEILRLPEEVRASKRPTAPFSKGTRKANPKKPGRKPGQGPFVRRAQTVPGPADKVENLAAPLDATICPQCGVNSPQFHHRRLCVRRDRRGSCIPCPQ